VQEAVAKAQIDATKKVIAAAKKLVSILRYQKEKDCASGLDVVQRVSQLATAEASLPSCARSGCRARRLEPGRRRARRRRGRRREVAIDVLRPGGVFVGKVFQGGATGDLLARLKQAFREVRHVKPPASRAESVELYVVATGFKSPES
jgi:hypothetical protein